MIHYPSSNSIYYLIFPTKATTHYCVPSHHTTPQIRTEHRALVASWHDFASKHHYDKPHLFLKRSYLDCAPVEQKALKKRLVKESVRTFRLRMDRDSMAFEDDLSYLNGLYATAKVGLGLC
jgi:hypothetical protein